MTKNLFSFLYFYGKKQFWNATLFLCWISELVFCLKLKKKGEGKGRLFFGMHLRIFAIILCCFRGRKEEKNIMSYCFYNNKVHFHMHNLYRVEKENSEKSFFFCCCLIASFCLYELLWGRGFGVCFKRRRHNSPAFIWSSSIANIYRSSLQSNRQNWIKHHMKDQLLKTLS